MNFVINLIQEINQMKKYYYTDEEFQELENHFGAHTPAPSTNKAFMIFQIIAIAILSFLAILYQM